MMVRECGAIPLLTIISRNVDCLVGLGTGPARRVFSHARASEEPSHAVCVAQAGGRVLLPDQELEIANTVLAHLENTAVKGPDVMLDRRRLLLAGVAGGLLSAWPWAVVAADAGPTERLTVLTRNGPIELSVELAETPEAQARGLMFRTALPDRHGMLFDFGTERPVGFWMRNTLIPLDMLFIDRTGVIRYIHPRAVPLSEKIIASPVPVSAVLEISGGGAEALGIRVGDRLSHRIFTGRASE